VLLAGGNTAHVFASLAPKLATHFHVYGITRRGAGVSSSPPSGYTVRQSGDDVAAVLDALGLTDPVLIGHSAAGQEMSAVSKYHPGRAAALVYLDAGGPFALYNPDHAGRCRIGDGDDNEGKDSNSRSCDVWRNCCVRLPYAALLSSKIVY